MVLWSFWAFICASFACLSSKCKRDSFARLHQLSITYVRIFSIWLWCCSFQSEKKCDVVYNFPLPFRIVWLWMYLSILYCIFFSRSLLFPKIYSHFFPLLLILNWWCTILIAVYGLYCAFLFHCNINGLFWRNNNKKKPYTIKDRKKRVRKKNEMGKVIDTSIPNT